MIGALVVWAVSGAALAKPCEWPSVATFRAGETKCTATLVESRVFLTAAHCLEAGEPGRVRFGEDFSPYEVRVDVEACFAPSQYFETRSPKDDYAACVLAEALPDIPIVPIAMGCETEALVPGATAAIVGFGQPALGEDFGLKHWAATTITERVVPPELIEVGDAAANGCLGDSGGPGFVQLPDQTWRTFGILAAGPRCGEGPSLYALVHHRVAWLEAQTGFDLTPCHDADGTWNPSEACQGFGIDPQAAASWDDHCDAPRYAPASACPEGLMPETTGAEPSEDETDPDNPTGCACSTGTPGGVLGSLVGLLLFGRRRGPDASRRSRRDTTPSRWAGGWNLADNGYYVRDE